MLSTTMRTGGGTPGARARGAPRRDVVPTRRSRRGLTVPEVLIALAILAMLLAAVAGAVQAVLTSYTENARIAEVTQTARVVLNRMMKEIRTADAVDTASQRVTLIPPPNGEGVTEVEYELVDGALHYRRTVNGQQSDQVIIDSNESVRIDAFNVVRETAVGGDDVIYTKSVTATLTLSSGANSFQVTASVCPRRNMTY